MSTEKIENTLLALMRAKSGVVPALKVVCVALQVGPLASEADFSVYFPVDALITLGPEHAAQGVVAVIGQHGCVGPLQDGVDLMQAHVMVAGRAFRVDWSPVHDDPAAYAPWLWHKTAAMQILINQIAQWSFCVQHHTPMQSLSSWLLQCLAQHPNADLTVSLKALPQPIRQWVDQSQADVRHAPDVSGFNVHDGCLHILSKQELAAQACSCHAQMLSGN